MQRSTHTRLDDDLCSLPELPFLSESHVVSRTAPGFTGVVQETSCNFGQAWVHIGSLGKSHEIQTGIALHS